MGTGLLVGRSLCVRCVGDAFNGVRCVHVGGPSVFVCASIMTTELKPSGYLGLFLARFPMSSNSSPIYSQYKPRISLGSVSDL